MKRVYSNIIILLAFSLVVIVSCPKKEITVYELTSDVLPWEGGTINPSQATFDEGEQVTISAISSKGYYFKNWSGNISGTNNVGEFLELVHAISLKTRWYEYYKTEPI